MEDSKTLESAIQDEAGKAMAEIALKEAAEIKRLDEVHRASLDDFKKLTQDQTDARIRQESSRAENRAALDLKKFKLLSVEAFINRRVEEAVKEIRNAPRYKQFLLDSAAKALGCASQSIDVRICPNDLIYQDEIRSYLTQLDHSKSISVTEDPSIKWGGCVVVEKDGGRIFDMSVERIYFRRFRVIRQEVMKLIEEESKPAG